MKIIALIFLASMMTAQAADHQLHTFERVQLIDRYYSEGINAADINGDGHMDVIHGPFWFAGPDYQKSSIIYQAAPQNREGYANNFFSWPYDFNKDGLVDVLTAGFPGTPAFMSFHTSSLPTKSTLTVSPSFEASAESANVRRALRRFSTSLSTSASVTSTAGFSIFSELRSASLISG